MSDKLNATSSLNLIDKLNDDSRTARHLIKMVSECAENAFNAENEGQQGFLSYDSIYGVLNHAVEILESMDSNTQILWGRLRQSKASIKSIDDFEEVLNIPCKKT